MTTMRCEGCSRRVHISSIEEVDVLVCRQTHSSPAEYEVKSLCDLCREEDPNDEAFHRADMRFREQRGSHL
jgi:hypothetical protein